MSGGRRGWGGVFGLELNFIGGAVGGCFVIEDVFFFVLELVNVGIACYDCHDRNMRMRIMFTMGELRVCVVN